MVVTLVHGPWSSSVDPAAGGALRTLFHRDMPLLRTTGPDATHPLATACFPLVPYANRIADGRWPDGPDQPLPPNVDAQPHPLHGVGWLCPWTVTKARTNALIMRLCHQGSAAWPYPFIAEQRVRLTSAGLTILLAMTNGDTVPRPAGLGLHPYFRRQGSTRVQFVADTLMHSDAACLPTGRMLPAALLGDFAVGDRLKAPLIDHCYRGWRQTATICDAAGCIRLTARGTPFLHLFAPPDDSILCLEPVSHGPDAHNRAPAELRWLRPRERMAIALHIGLG
jgi:aldose 1-epimerase